VAARGEIDVFASQPLSATAVAEASEAVHGKGNIFMTEIVRALFESPATAEAAIEDLKVARIPSAVVRRGGGDSALRTDSNAIWHRNANAWQRPMITVAVDEMHADAVTGILRMFGPLRIEENV
jgi:hypothetical protein